MHTMPRLPPTRRSTRYSTILPDTMPSLSRIRRWASSCPASSSIASRREEERRNGHAGRELCCLRGRTEEISIDLDTHSLDSWHQCHTMPTHYFGRRLLLHTSPSDWDIERGSCSNCLVEDRFLCFHQSGSTTCIPPSIEAGGRCTPRDIQSMPIPSKYYSRQFDILLVGTNTCLSTSISANQKDSLGFCCKARGWGIRIECLRVDSQCSICHSSLTEFSGSAGDSQCFRYPRTSHEIIDDQFGYLASWLFCLVSIVPECIGWSYEIWRSRILHGLVEQSECRSLLADLE